MIQKTESDEPTTTMQVAKKWSFGGTRFHPKIMIPKKPASSMKADKGLRAQDLAEEGALRREGRPVVAEGKLQGKSRDDTDAEVQQ